MNISPLALAQNILQFKSQMIGSLFGSGDDTQGDFLSALRAQKSTSANASNDPLATLAQPNANAAPGNSLRLFDPASAFNMMSTINKRDVLHKAEFAEMHSMSDYVEQIESAAQRLSGIVSTTPNEEIRAQLQSFTADYNNLVQRFKPSVQNGGMLAGVQAAEISLYELEQSVKYKFFGAAQGLHGLGDLGISIDPLTKQAALDPAKLDALLATQKQAAVHTLQEFSANFAKSADLLNSDGNFIPNRLNNLGRAIQYIKDHQTDWQAEFGLGDPAKPNKQVAQALAAYNKIYAI